MRPWLPRWRSHWPPREGHTWIASIMALADPDTANQALDYVVDLGTAQPSLLVPYLKHTDAIVRERVATAVGFAGNADAEAALSQLTSDGDPSVRRSAETALIRMRVSKQAGTGKRF